MARLTVTRSVLVLAALLAAPLALAEEDEGETFFDGLSPVTAPVEDVLGLPLDDPVGSIGDAVSFDPWAPSPDEGPEPAPERGGHEESGGAFLPAPDLGLPELTPLPPVLTQQVVILKRLAPAFEVPLLGAPAPEAPASTVEPASAGPAVPLPAPPAEEAPAPTVSAAIVALASVAAVASTAAGSSGFDWERLRRFALGAMLYTRIAKDRLLDHGRRDALLAAVRDRPGSTLIDLAEGTAIPRNTATYHLNRLEREGFVTSTRQGRGRLYFAVGGDARRAQADAFAALRHDKGRALALAVGEAPGLDQQALCAKLGLTPSLVHWHADRLLAAGVLSKEREGRHVRYHPGPAYGLVGSLTC